MKMQKVIEVKKESTGGRPLPCILPTSVPILSMEYGAPAASWSLLSTELAIPDHSLEQLKILKKICIK